MDDNPYQSPLAKSPTRETSRSHLTWLGKVAIYVRPIFIRWELLRILYIAIAGLVVVVTAMELNLELFSLNVLPEIVFYAVVANICFFAGPIVETYFSWIGIRTLGSRIALFIGGTGLTCILAHQAVIELAN